MATKYPRIHRKVNTLSLNNQVLLSKPRGVQFQESISGKFPLSLYPNSENMTAIAPIMGHLSYHLVI